MAKMHLIVGLDDIATGSGQCKGWTSFIMPADGRAWFDRKAAEIAKNLPKQVFHARQYMGEHRAHYRDFLALIKDTIFCTAQARAFNYLYPAHAIQEIAQTVQKSISGIAKSVGITKAENGQKVLGATFPIALPTRILIENADWLGPDITMSIEIDSSQKLGTSPVACMIDGSQWDTCRLLQQAMNTIIQSISSRIPKLNDRPVAVVKDERSFLVQAADVFGNFSLAYIYHRLGMESGNYPDKATLFEDTFGDKIKASSLPPELSLKGDQLQLTGQALVISAKWEWTKHGILASNGE